MINKNESQIVQEFKVAIDSDLLSNLSVQFQQLSQKGATGCVSVCTNSKDGLIKITFTKV
jgi:hypothetical protein